MEDKYSSENLYIEYVDYSECLPERQSEIIEELLAFSKHNLYWLAQMAQQNLIDWPLDIPLEDMIYYYYTKNRRHNFEPNR